MDGIGDDKMQILKKSIERWTMEDVFVQIRTCTYTMPGLILFLFQMDCEHFQVASIK